MPRHPQRQRLHAAQDEETILRSGHGADGVLEELQLGEERSSSVITAPPSASLWPLMYFVVECTTMSAPRAIGCCSTGVAKVLSTTVRIPARRAMALQAAMSVIFSSGFDGVSSQSSFVSGRMARSTAADRCYR